MRTDRESDDAGIFTPIDRNIYISDKTDIESPDSSIITSSANQIFYQDIRADSSFQTFNRQKKVSGGPACLSQINTLQHDWPDKSCTAPLM